MQKRLEATIVYWSKGNGKENGNYCSTPTIYEVMYEVLNKQKRKMETTLLYRGYI